MAIKVKYLTEDEIEKDAKLLLAEYEDTIGEPGCRCRLTRTLSSPMASNTTTTLSPTYRGSSNIQTALRRKVQSTMPPQVRARGGPGEAVYRIAWPAPVRR